MTKDAQLPFLDDPRPPSRSGYENCWINSASDPSIWSSLSSASKEREWRPSANRRLIQWKLIRNVMSDFVQGLELTDALRRKMLEVQICFFRCKRSFILTTRG
jgi:hypothetical protein